MTWCQAGEARLAEAWRDIISYVSRTTGGSGRVERVMWARRGRRPLASIAGRAHIVGNRCITRDEQSRSLFAPGGLASRENDRRPPVANRWG